MNIETIEDSYFLFLEEIPLEEISCEKMKEIIDNYRKGITNVLDSTFFLEQYCGKTLEYWLNTNKELSRI